MVTLFEAFLFLEEVDDLVQIGKEAVEYRS